MIINKLKITIIFQFEIFFNVGNHIDGKAFGATSSQFNIFLAAFPEIPRGFLFRVYQGFQKQCYSSPEEDVSDTDTVPIEDSSFLSNTSMSKSVNSDETQSSASSSVSSISETNLTKPVPKEFPLELCNFGYNAKEIIRSGNITEAGKREVTSELVAVMRRYER